MTTINVNGASPYDVVIDKNLGQKVASFASALSARKALIVTQPTVEHYARNLAQLLSSESLEAHIHVVPDAEHGKTLDVCGAAWDKLGELKFSRSDIVIGLGGGAATDLAGFIAASWMRGVKVIQIPTTLLAMVDAAVGGKTGINTAAGKNLVGAFHEPAGVFIDLDFLETLPKEEIIAGSAEIIKTGFIQDPKILELYEADPAACLEPSGYLPELIARSVTVKAAVVGVDLKESGLREILNYGHTFGHAIELRENYTWRHGHAVAVGMMFIAALSHARGLIDEDLLKRHREIISSVGLPVDYEGGHFEELYSAMTVDKKNKGGHIRFVAINSVGDPTRIEDANDAEIRAAYEAISA